MRAKSWIRKFLTYFAWNSSIDARVLVFDLKKQLKVDDSWDNNYAYLADQNYFQKIVLECLKQHLSRDEFITFERYISLKRSILKEQYMIEERIKGAELLLRQLKESWPLLVDFDPFNLVLQFTRWNAALNRILSLAYPTLTLVHQAKFEAELALKK